MAFTDIEISNNEGKPFRLYTLRWGNTIWRYTNADRVREWPAGSGNNFQPIAISDGGVRQSGSDQDDFRVTLPQSAAIVDKFRGTPPSETIWLTVRKQHEGDAEAPAIYVGKVANVKRSEGRTTAEIRCIAISAAYKTNGLRIPWGRNCPYILYDFNCRADKELFKVVAEVTAISGVEVTVDALGAWDEAQYIGGFLEWDADGLGTLERRAIEAPGGDRTFALLGRTDGLEVGQTLSLYIGCAHVTSACDGVFDNLANYGGFPHIPGKSPFDGTPVF